MNIRSLLRPLLILVVLAAVFGIISCGGGGDAGGSGGGSGGGQGVVLATPQTNLAFNQSIAITATVPGQTNQTVIFSTDGGKLIQTGPHSANYTAPATAGTYHIRAVSDANNALAGSLTITVSSTSISITPPSAVLAPGQTIQFTGNVQGANDTAVVFSVSGGTFTTINSTTISYRAPATAGPYTITAAAHANQALKAVAQVTVSNGGGNSATVTGRVGDSNGAPLSGVVVQFFDSNNQAVAQATVNGGSFSASVPTKATRFNLLPSSIDQNSLYESYTYNTLRYSPLISTCTAPLPALSAGGTIALATNIVIPTRQGPPPPPPDGCTG